MPVSKRLTRLLIYEASLKDQIAALDVLAIRLSTDEPGLTGDAFIIYSEYKNSINQAHRLATILRDQVIILISQME